MLRWGLICAKTLAFYETVLYYLVTVRETNPRAVLNIDSFYIMFSSYFLLLKALGFSPGVFNCPLIFLFRNMFAVIGGFFILKIIVLF